MNRVIASLGAALILAAAPAHAATAEPGPALSAKPHLSVIGRAPEFALRDLKGRKVRLSDYAGRVTLLAFIFTSCKAVCPVISAQMRTLQTHLKQAGLFPDRARLLSVTVDPITDTTAVLARYAETFQADPAGWTFLREEPERMKPVLRAYDEWTKVLPPADLDHPARVYLIDRNRNIREIYSLSFFNEKQAFIDIGALLNEASTGSGGR